MYFHSIFSRISELRSFKSKPRKEQMYVLQALLNLQTSLHRRRTPSVSCPNLESTINCVRTYQFTSIYYHRGDEEMYTAEWVYSFRDVDDKTIELKRMNTESTKSKRRFSTYMSYSTRYKQLKSKNDFAAQHLHLNQKLIKTDDVARAAIFPAVYPLSVRFIQPEPVMGTQGELKVGNFENTRLQISTRTSFIRTNKTSVSSCAAIPMSSQWADWRV